jgi:hypothetical protein
MEEEEKIVILIAPRIGGGEAAEREREKEE